CRTGSVRDARAWALGDGLASEPGDDGHGRAALESAQCRESNAHPHGSGGNGDFTAADYRLDFRHHTEDGRTRPRTGASETCHFPECFHRGTAPGVDADHAKVPSGGVDPGVPGLSI